MTISRPEYPYHYLPVQLKCELCHLGTFLTHQGKVRNCTTCGFHKKVSLFNTTKQFVSPLHRSSATKDDGLCAQGKVYI